MKSGTRGFIKIYCYHDLSISGFTMKPKVYGPSLRSAIYRRPRSDFFLIKGNFQDCCFSWPLRINIVNINLWGLLKMNRVKIQMDHLILYFWNDFLTRKWIYMACYYSRASSSKCGMTENITLKKIETLSKNISLRYKWNFLQFTFFSPPPY